MLLPSLCSLEGGLKIAEGSSPLCFLLRPPGGAGSAARTLAKLLVLSSPAAGSDLLGHEEDSLDELSPGEFLVTLNSDSWADRERERGEQGGQPSPLFKMTIL